MFFGIIYFSLLKLPPPPRAAICYNISNLVNMASTQEQMTLDYLFSSNNAEVVRRNGRNTNLIKIGGVSYRYNRNLPITRRLKTKLNKVRKTMDFKKYELEKTKNVKWTK